MFCLLYTQVLRWCFRVFRNFVFGFCCLCGWFCLGAGNLMVLGLSWFPLAGICGFLEFLMVAFLVSWVGLMCLCFIGVCDFDFDVLVVRSIL